jgi:hypothetical protein
MDDRQAAFLLQLQLPVLDDTPTSVTPIHDAVDPANSV